MKVFFDNCTSPVLATTLHGFIQHENHSAYHIKDLSCGRDAADEDWIAMLARDSAVWIVITADDRIRRNPAIRRAYRSASLTGFVLAPAFQKMQLHKVASFLLWRWPEIERLAALVTGPALHELPINRSAKMRQLPL